MPNEPVIGIDAFLGSISRKSVHDIDPATGEYRARQDTSVPQVRTSMFDSIGPVAVSEEVSPVSGASELAPVIDLSSRRKL